MSRDPNEKLGSNAPSTWCTTSPTRSSVDVRMEEVATYLSYGEGDIACI